MTYAGAGVVTYRVDLGRAALEALLVDKGSDVLVVSFHGALDRSKVTLPRFERYRSLADTQWSSLYFGDPTLHLDDELTLTWYTGWLELDLHQVLAEQVRTAAADVGARHIVLSGSSGGGFAALAVASYLPGSVAVPFSPQTAISRYLVNGKRWVQRRYVEAVMPHLAPRGFRRLDPDVDWSEPLGGRASMVRRYQVPQPARVMYVQNINDVSHVHDHYRPFVEAVNASGASDALRVWEYEGPAKHNVPDRDTFVEGLTQGLRFLRG